MNRLDPKMLLATVGLLASLGAQQAGTAVRVPLTQPVLRELELPAFRVPVRSVGWRNGPCDGRLTVALGDVDRDGDLDVVYGPTAGQTPRLLLNDGNGRLTEVTATAMPNDIRQVYQFALADLDNDGDLDYVSANYEGSNYDPASILINNGTGRFTIETAQRGLTLASFPISVQACVAVADFDRDGDNDIVLGGSAHSSHPASGFLLRNNGQGYFTYDPSAFPQDHELRDPGILPGFVTGDMDGDGDTDLLARCSRGGIAYWLNDGSGRFTDAVPTHIHPPPSSYVSIGMNIADLDGDGDLDAVVARAYMRGPALLYLNDGSGQLYESSAGRIPPQSDAGLFPGLFDIDGDGDDELVVFQAPLAPSFAGAIQVLVNDGQADFTLDESDSYLARAQNNGGVYYVVQGDMDGDGDLDMFIADGCTVPAPTGRQRYFLYTTRHVWADLRPARGAFWRVNVTGRPGGFGVLALAFGSANTPLPPFGSLGLDPRSTMVWPALLPFDRERLAVAEIPIPDLPVFAGRPLYAQALCVEPSGLARFSNLWIEDSIR
ncbi:MAG: VCBS repeat-containing protein [Planctomycetes bacterium]|nr:VCBS repeat-containing protein [Planctomycetota bacterium]